jgi:hypothetical protein
MAKSTNVATKGKRPERSHLRLLAAKSPDAEALRRKTIKFALARVRDAIGPLIEAKERRGRRTAGTQLAEIRKRATTFATRVQDGCRRLFQTPDRGQEWEALREADDLAKETAQKVREALDQFRCKADNLPAWPLIGTFPMLRHFIENQPIETVGWLHSLPPAPPRSESSVVDRILNEFWPLLSGDAEHCRVCDAKLVSDGCERCGAESVFARGAPPQGGAWWRGKARPRHLALVYLLADVVTDGEWLKWAREGETPETVLETLRKRVRTRLAERRQLLRAHRRKIVSRDTRSG